MPLLFTLKTLLRTLYVLRRYATKVVLYTGALGASRSVLDFRAVTTLLRALASRSQTLSTTSKALCVLKISQCSNFSCIEPLDCVSSSFSQSHAAAHNPSVPPLALVLLCLSTSVQTVKIECDLIIG